MKLEVDSDTGSDLTPGFHYRVRRRRGINGRVADEADEWMRDRQVVLHFVIGTLGPAL